MTKQMTTLTVLMAASALAGCGGGTAKLLNPAPYADVYNATYASAEKDVMSKVLAKAGDTIEGGAISARNGYSDALDADEVVLQEPEAVKIEKTADGYILHASGEKVAFTAAEDKGGYYELVVKNQNGHDRTIGYFYAAFDDLAALQASDSSMVPLGYGIRVKDGDAAATADDADGFVNGFTIVGLETNPSAMPKTGTASYQGGAQIQAHPKVVDYDPGAPDMVERIRYRGDAMLSADFGAGTVSGTVALNDRRFSYTKSPNSSNDPTVAGAALTLETADIIGNGFSSELTANAAAATQMATDGISADTQATAVGRFYGTDAGQVGAIVGGEGTSHVITGVLAGDRTP
ncbi:transferrin-binding protein-like solute binding protein [Nitratireductor thuwali]|uniref:Transferrin-binding protein B C-lobe/N-lobe beta-barrel domain-containing protein n=1 Tax=Nitratireductor thuwali TaxID=2267699 RepID=A0ABY5MQP6_9HYPH|nr:hypothetical protein NTH_04142 [Nitratireductor thuwali]